MRLPSLGALSLTLPSFGWFEGVNGRRFLLYSLYSVALFAIFMLVNFPHQAVVQGVLSRADLGPLRLDVRNTRFAWWRGWELQDIVLRQAGKPDPLLEIPSLYVSPSLEGLLSGRLSTVEIDGAMYGGRVKGSLSDTKEVSRAAVRFERLMLGRYPEISAQLEQGQVTGALSGDISFENRRGDKRAGRAAGDFVLAGASLTDAVIQGFTVPDLHFDSTTLRFAFQAGQLEIEELLSAGDELEIRAAGQVAVRDPLPDSVLNLRVKAVPGPNSTDAVSGFLLLLPQPPKGRPDAPFSVGGTIRKPRIR